MRSYKGDRKTGGNNMRGENICTLRKEYKRGKEYKKGKCSSVKLECLEENEKEETLITNTLLL